MNGKILLLNIFSLSLGVLCSCKGPAPQMQGGPVPVNLAVAEEKEAVYYDVYPGNIVAQNEVQLRSEVNGYITAILFQEGQTVKKGEKLYDIERSKYAASFAQAEANVSVAKSNVSKTQKDAERYNELAKDDAVAKQRVDYAKTDYENAKQQLDAAEAQLASTRTDLNHTQIIAPFDGTIGISLVKLGTFVSAGQTQLNTISSDDPISVDFTISEKEIPRFTKMIKGEEGKQDSLFTLLLPDQSIYPFPGEVFFLDRAVDPQTGTLRIRLKFPNHDHSLKAGMSCNIRILNKNNHQQVQIPFRAVTEQMGEFFVYLAKNDTARQQRVVLGQPIADKIIVLSGLEGGEKIVVDGIQKLKDGSPIQLGPPPGATGGPNGPSPSGTTPK